MPRCVAYVEIDGFGLKFAALKATTKEPALEENSYTAIPNS